MRKFIVITVLIISFIYSLMGQKQILSLDDCIKIGIENNLVLKDKYQNVQKGNYGLSESRAQLLPIINGYGNFTNNIERNTSVSDGSGMGALLGIDMPYMASRGLRYVTSGGLQMSVPLYDQTIYAGISIAKKMKEINSLSYDKAKEDLMIQISKLYYLGQTSAEQLILIHENIGKLEELRDITTAFFDNGMALDVDLKRVNINLENLQVQYDNALAMYQQQLNLLKYVLDMGAEKEIELETLDANNTDSPAFNGVSPDLKELQLLNTQKNLVEKQKKSIKAGYFPSLSFTSQLSYTDYTDHFENYFHSHPSNKWYNGFNFGLSLKIPIFDGFSKNLKLKKAGVDYTKIQLQLENTQKQLHTNYMNAVNDWMNNKRSYVKQKDNYALAEEVYKVTSDKYKEGVVSMTELLQDEIRMSDALNNYLSAHYNYKLSELSLLKLTNQLDYLSK